MASVFVFGEDNGAVVHVPQRGTTRTTGVSNVNWKNIDDTTTAYSSSVIAAGSNSYEKFQWGHWTGSYNSISSIKFQHVSGALGDGLTIKCFVSGSGLYTAPSTTTNASLLHNLTSTGAISTGLAVKIGILGPEHTGKGTSSASGALALYSEYIVTQLQTTTAASPGDITQCTFQMQWTED